MGVCTRAPLQLLEHVRLQRAQVRAYLLNRANLFMS